MSVGIWCVERQWGGRTDVGRWATRDGKTLIFNTEKEAMAETARLRASSGFWAGGKWVFFPFPVGTAPARGALT